MQGGDDLNLRTKKLDKQWECPMDQTMIGSLPKVIHAPSGMADQISPQRTCTQQGGLELAKKSGLEDPTLSPIISGSQFLQMGGCFSQDICTLNEDVLRGANMGMESGSTPADHIRVHTTDGVTFMSKDKWPNLFVGEKNITQDGEG